MTDKISDNDIKKALDSYKKDIGCAKCGFEDKYLLTILENALDYINRLEAENERLTAKNLLLEHNSTEIVSASYFYELEKQRERAERYKEKWIAEIKAEAYKEFAERLKEKYGYYDWENKTIVYPEDELDNLLKEMVGEDNG